MSMISNT